MPAIRLLLILCLLTGICRAQTWSHMGSPLSAFVSSANTWVEMVKIVDTTLYMGGAFQKVGSDTGRGIAYWNGTDWQQYGLGINGRVHDIFKTPTLTYVTGNIINALPNVPNTKHLAAWDGTQWVSVNTQAPNDYCTGVVFKNELYLGGLFNYMGVPTNVMEGIVKWDGSSWSLLEGGLNSLSFSPVIYTMKEWNNEIYIGGYFSSANTTSGVLPLGNIARWDGNQWQAIGNGLPGSFSINDIDIDTINNVLYAGGGPGIFRWDGVQ